MINPTFIFKLNDYVYQKQILIVFNEYVHVIILHFAQYFIMNMRLFN